MKLNFPLLDSPVEINGVCFLVLENTQLYAQIVKWIYQFDEEIDLKIYDNKFCSLKNTELMIITDIMGYDINSKQILKLVYSDIESQLNDKPEVKSMIENLSNTITDLISYELLENELDLEYDEITILELIDSLGVKIETYSDTIFEKIFEILQIFKYLSKKKLLIFINSCAYLTEKEISSIIEYINLNNINCLFIEPRQVYEFKQNIIDNDYFLTIKY